MFCIFVFSEQNPQTNRFLGSLLDFMYLEVPTFPWGEFNSVLDPDLDRIHPPSYQEKAPSTSAEGVAALQSLLSYTSTYPVSRFRHPKDRCFS